MGYVKAASSQFLAYTGHKPKETPSCVPAAQSRPRVTASSTVRALGHTGALSLRPAAPAQVAWAL